MTIFLTLLLTTLSLAGAACFWWKIYRQAWVILVFNLAGSYVAWMFPEGRALMALAFIDVVCFWAMYRLSQKALAAVFAGMVLMYGAAAGGVLGFPRPIADFIDVLVHVQHAMLIFMAWDNVDGGKRVGLVRLARAGSALRGFAHNILHPGSHHGHS